MLKKSKEIVKTNNSNKLQQFLDFEKNNKQLTIIDKKILSDLKDQADYYSSKLEEVDVNQQKELEKELSNTQKTIDNSEKLTYQQYKVAKANKNKKPRKNIQNSAKLYNKLYETVLYDVTENKITAKEALNNLLKNKSFVNEFNPNDIKSIANNYNKKYPINKVKSYNDLPFGFTIFAFSLITAGLMFNFIPIFLLGYFIIVLPGTLLLSLKYNQTRDLTTSNHCNELYKQNNRLELTRRNVEHAYLRDSEDDITFAQYAVSVKEIKDKNQDINYEISLVKYRPTQNSYTIKKSKVKIFSKQDYDKAIEYKLELEELAASLENDSKLKFNSLSNDLLETKTNISNKLLEENLEEIENKALLESLRGY